MKIHNVTYYDSDDLRRLFDHVRSDALRIVEDARKKWRSENPGKDDRWMPYPLMQIPEGGWVPHELHVSYYSPNAQTSLAYEASCGSPLAVKPPSAGGDYRARSSSLPIYKLGLVRRNKLEGGSPIERLADAADGKLHLPDYAIYQIAWRFIAICTSIAATGWAPDFIKEPFDAVATRAARCPVRIHDKATDGSAKEVLKAARRAQKLKSLKHRVALAHEARNDAFSEVRRWQSILSEAEAKLDRARTELEDFERA